MINEIQVNITLIIQMVVFFIAIWIINKQIFGPLVKVFEDRKKNTVGFDEEANILKKDALKAKDAYSKNIKNAQEKAKEIKVELRNKGKEEEEKIIKIAREKAAVSIKEIKENIEKEKAKAKENLLEQTKAFGREIAEKILARKVA